jgi:hypothetical protein
MIAQTDLTVRKSVTVACSPEDAFALFTEGMSTWWPFETHSPGEGVPEAIVIEPREGGRVFDRRANGEEAEWATVTAWEPPSRFAIDWHVNPAKPTTEVDVRFPPDGSGTRVDLTHSGWERYGDTAHENFESYNSGWDTVLRPYIDRGNA